MTWNKELWLKLIKTDKKVSLLQDLWKFYAVKKNIEYETIEELIELLPGRNIIHLLEPEETYQVMMNTIGFNQNGLIKSILGDQIRAYHHQDFKKVKYGIRKYWYKLFKARFQRLFQIAYDNGEYQYDLEEDPNFYEQIPRKISTNLQYWSTNDIKESKEIYEISKSKRNAVIDYKDIGIKDISRKRKWINPKVRIKYILEHFKQFENEKTLKNTLEEKFDVKITLYEPLEKIIEILEKENEEQEKALDEDRIFEDDFYIIGLVEKDADYEEIESLGEMLGIPILSGHGQNALASFEDFIISNMQKGSNIIVLSFTDCDPSGFFIARSFVQQQSIKLGVKPILWIYTEFWNKLTLEQRQEQAYIPKQYSKTRKSKVVKYWFDTIGYDMDLDQFGGGKYGFEIEAIENNQFREATKDLFYSIGITALAVLETLKDENREDIEEVCYTIAENWFDSTDSELKEKMEKLNRLIEELKRPIDSIIYDLEEVKQEIFEKIIEMVEPKAIEISSEEDFDDRDAKEEIESFETDLMRGLDHWSNQWYSELNNNSYLNEKLVKETEKFKDELIEIDFADFQLPNIDKDDLKKELSEIIDNFDLGDSAATDPEDQNDMKFYETLNLDEKQEFLRDNYFEIIHKLQLKYREFFESLSIEKAYSKILECEFSYDKILQWLKDLLGEKSFCNECEQIKDNTSWITPHRNYNVCKECYFKIKNENEETSY